MAHKATRGFLALRTGKVRLFFGKSVQKMGKNLVHLATVSVEKGEWFCVKGVLLNF
jgi:hypothetical protein